MIIQPIGHIAIMLDLIESETFSPMNGAAGDQERVRVGLSLT